MKVRALKSFEGIRDLERSKIEGKDVFPKEGDIWETSEKRAKFLEKHGVVEIIEEKKAIFKVDSIAKELFDSKLNEIEKHKIKKKKSSKK